jgi:hypothetical protein
VPPQNARAMHASALIQQVGQRNIVTGATQKHHAIAFALDICGLNVAKTIFFCKTQNVGGRDKLKDLDPVSQVIVVVDLPFN